MADNEEKSITAPEVPQTDADAPLETTSTNPLKNAPKPGHPTGLALALILLSLCLTVLLVALDATIIATAIPTITSQFNSLDDYSWYNSAYLLCTCAFQLPFGRFYSLLSTKWTFVAAIVLFEVGSAVCGAAPTSIALIIGRAIQGTGGAGIFGGSLIIIAENTPLRRRSLYAGLLGAMFGIASVVGPLLGGTFTDKITWRWCFYINLPLGAMTLVIVILFLPAGNKDFRETFKDQTPLKIINRFDPIGTLILLPSIISLLLALTWGGVTYDWSSPTIIGLLVCFGGSICIWLGLQWRAGDNATLPFKVLKQRSVASAAIYTFFGSAVFSIAVYYLPLWFQAVLDDSAFTSGIHLLPSILSVVFFAISAGGGVAALGYYVPFLYGGTVLMSIGQGLLMTLKPSSSIGEWIGFQIVLAAGVGMSLEQCNVAVQAVLPDDLIASGTSLVVFTRALGGALSVTIAQTTFSQSLNSRLSTVLPDVSSNAVSGIGATDLIEVIRKAAAGNEAKIVQALEAVNYAVTRTFLVGLVLACFTLPPALCMEWKNVKKEKKEEPVDEEKAKVEKTEDQEVDNTATSPTQQPAI